VRAPEEGTSGRKSLFAAEDERTRLLRAVVALSASEGYAELTTPQIAAAAGVSVEEFCRLSGSPEQ
jgi:AcrR family transcriptional regulator